MVFLGRSLGYYIASVQKRYDRAPVVQDGDVGDKLGINTQRLGAFCGCFEGAWTVEAGLFVYMKGGGRNCKCFLFEIVKLKVCSQTRFHGLSFGVGGGRQSKLAASFRRLY